MPARLDTHRVLYATPVGKIQCCSRVEVTGSSLAEQVTGEAKRARAGGPAEIRAARRPGAAVPALPPTPLHRKSSPALGQSSLFNNAFVELKHLRIWWRPSIRSGEPLHPLQLICALWGEIIHKNGVIQGWCSVVTIKISARRIEWYQWSVSVLCCRRRDNNQMDYSAGGYLKFLTSRTFTSDIIAYLRWDIFGICGDKLLC